MTYGRRHYLTQLILVRLAYAGPTSAETREFLKASLRFVVGMTLVFFGLVAVASGAEVATATNGGGEFRFKSGSDREFEVAPLVETRVRFDVTGVIARATVVQRFRNPLDAWIEGVYVFPLPESAAVDHMRMRAGERVIEGRIREKEQARQEFQQAAGEGKRATLIEQQRSNLFTSRVANLGPLEELEVEIEYQQTLELEEGRVGLRFPLAITPRYEPASPTFLVDLVQPPPPPYPADWSPTSPPLEPLPYPADWSPTSPLAKALPYQADWSLTSPPAKPLRSTCEDRGPSANSLYRPRNESTSLPLTDENLVQPPLLPRSAPRNSVSIELNLNAGFEVAAVTSATHALSVEPLSGHQYQVRLRDQQVPADRDLEITWSPTPGVVPQSSITTEKGPDGTYALVSLFPPSGGAVSSVRLPREVTFVIDTSGSMAGLSIQQARQALALAIGRLDAMDFFNVIQFNSVTSVLFTRPVAATPEHREQAIRYVRSLEAEGGTEMLPALSAALNTPTQLTERFERVKQVIFLTDGAVSNEDQLFSVIKARLGRARLFTVGIGSAPNSHFMTKAAEFGRGTFTFISDLAVVEQQMTELFAKVESPVLSDIEIAFEGVEPEHAEVWPDRIPDLYLGEPVVVGVRFAQAPTGIRVRGQLDGQPYETVAPLAQAEAGRGINVLWARRKIQSLLDGLHEGDDPEAVRAQVVSLGLTHHLVTRHTSLVAVDVTPSRPADESMESLIVPVNAPHGSVAGTLPQSATPATLLLLQGLLATLAAAAVLRAVRR